MTHARNTPAIQRQVVLPTSKAAEIAWMNIRMRLSRSLVVTSGIVLAIAFLASVLLSETVLSGVTGWRQEVLARPFTAGVVDPDRLAVQQLETRMRSAGVLADGDDDRDRIIQRRWLIGLALLVAFVGILNAMLMSVTERFREIGTMKCLGALDGFIVKLFLLESLFQGVAGTVLGCVLGLGAAVASAAGTFGRFAWVNLPVGQILLDLGVCLLVGVGLTVLAAVYPARQAARMQPIAAMRVEA